MHLFQSKRTFLLGFIALSFMVTTRMTFAADYDFQIIDQTPKNPVPIFPGTTMTLTLTIKNTGTKTWFNSGNNPMRLGTSNPQNRDSNFYKSGNKGWRSAQRINMVESSVQTGQLAHFTFDITPNGNATSRQEYFCPVIDGITWMKDIGIYWDIKFATTNTPSQPVPQSPSFRWPLTDARGNSFGYKGFLQHNSRAGSQYHCGVDIIFDPRSIDTAKSLVGKLPVYPITDGTVIAINGRSISNGLSSKDSCNQGAFSNKEVCDTNGCIGYDDLTKCPFGQKKCNSGLGYSVLIRHDNKYNGRTFYSQIDHMAYCPEVKVGSSVTKNTVIGYGGTTGASNFPHIHFETFYSEKWSYAYYNQMCGSEWIDPMTLIGSQKPNTY